MGRRRFKPEQIIHMLREAEIKLAGGKVERSHRIDEQELYQLIDQNGITDEIHLSNEKLREWEDYYNYHRPHGALQGRTPYERLVEKSRADVSQGS